MEKKEFLLLLDDLIYEDPGTLNGPEILKELEGWDSLAAVGFIALVDEEFEIILDPQKISICETVDDLVGLLNENLILGS